MLLLLLVEEVQIFSRHFQYCFLSDETILWRARKILFANRFANDSADVSARRQIEEPISIADCFPPNRGVENLDGQTDCFKIDRICLSVVNPSAVRWLGIHHHHNIIAIADHRP